MIGFLVLIWVFYFRYYVLSKSRFKVNMLNAKDELLATSSSSSSLLSTSKDEPLSNGSSLSSSSQSTHNNVPWMDILNKSSFW
jgi:hypothetical protein